ncbi:MAG TPA: cellulose synthase complex periplasmic endoglucanase BcsZ [Terracidiphilus sp.]|nr:cellulose synthase complex periplasmic endoglucanase BcsZ [Terracidiphilus sp.]
MGLSTSRAGKRALLIVALSMCSMTGGCKEGPWRLWNSYASRFIDPQSGRVFDPSGDQHTTSEGQAYALFFSLADNDRPTFNRVLAWTEKNLASGDLTTHLPAWLWGKDKDGQWKILDPNSASDADVWMAYSLLEAGRLWKSSADANLGRAMLALIASKEVVNLPGFGPMLVPGPAGFQLGDNWILNPSYLPIFVFERFAALDPTGPWQQIVLSIPRLLAESSPHGYAMDWVEYVPGDGFYPMPKPSDANQNGPNASGPGGSYDAIRVYLWAGMIDSHDPSRDLVLQAVPAMSGFLANHDVPREMVSDQGIPGEQDGPVGFSAAVLPYLRAYPDSSRAIARQMIRLSAQKDATSGLYGKDTAYYDQNLALFATGFLDARFRFGPGGELNVEWKRR